MISDNVNTVAVEKNKSSLSLLVCFPYFTNIGKVDTERDIMHVATLFTMSGTNTFPIFY